MQPSFDPIPILILPRAHLPAQHISRLQHDRFVPSLSEILRARQPAQPAADDGDSLLLRPIRLQIRRESLRQLTGDAIVIRLIDVIRFRVILRLDAHSRASRRARFRFCPRARRHRALRERPIARVQRQRARRSRGCVHYIRASLSTSLFRAPSRARRRGRRRVLRHRAVVTFWITYLR